MALNKLFNRRSLLSSAALLMLGSSPSFAQELTKVKVGWLRSSLSLVLHPIAMEEGFYKKNGIEPLTKVVRSGDGSIGPQSVLQGELDIYIGVISDVAKINSEASETGMQPPLAVVALGSPGATNLVLKSSLPFNGLDDIKGLRIGVSSLGSAHLVTFRQYLAEKGTTVEKLGLRLVPVGGGDMPPALISGQIDGFLHSQPTPAIAVATGQAKLVLAPNQMGIAGTSPNVGIIVSRKWASANKATLVKFVNALRETSEAYPTIPRDRIVKIAVTHLGGEPEQIAGSYDSVDPRLVAGPKGADTYWAVEMAAMKERGEVGKNFQQKDLFDFGLIQ